MPERSNPGDAVRIERTVDAPIEVVWSMWTEPEHFAAWYGPMGASIPVAEIDLRPGGIRRVCMAMETPNGPMRMWFTGEHRIVEAPTRLVYTEAMCDEDGNPIDPQQMGMSGEHAVTEVTVELRSVGGRTSMILTHAGIPSDSPGAMGWNMALDKLETYVRQRADNER